MSINRDLADSAAVPPFRKNIIINGDMRIWQRGTTFTATPTNFTADRFEWVQAGAGVVTALRTTADATGKVGYSLKIDVTTADASIAAGDVYGIRYPIEAQDMEHFNIGTVDAKTVTLSFWVASSKTGTHSGSFRNSAADRSYVFEYTVDATGTWEYKTITIPLDTTGTWLPDNSLGMDIFFSIATGTTFQGTVDAWSAGNFVGSSNQVNVMDNVANNFWITNVQLEVGTEATDFEYRPFGEELALCQRYYEVGTKEWHLTYIDSSVTGDRVSHRFATTKRATPSLITISNPLSVVGDGTINSTVEDDAGFSTSMNAGRTTIGVSRAQFDWIADAEL